DGGAECHRPDVGCASHGARAGRAARAAPRRGPRPRGHRRRRAVATGCRHPARFSRHRRVSRRRVPVRPHRRIHEALGARCAGPRHGGGHAARRGPALASPDPVCAAAGRAERPRRGERARARPRLRRGRLSPLLPPDRRHRARRRVDGDLPDSALWSPLGDALSRRSIVDDDAGGGRAGRAGHHSRLAKLSTLSPMGTVVLLAAQVGGAKLADGLYRLRGMDLTVVVNTGDDYRHLGLAFSPDLDTMLFTLAGIASDTAGWEPEGETRALQGMLRQLGGPDRPLLGDRSLAAPLLRAEGLAEERRLTEITRDFCRHLGIEARVLPMSDDPVRTHVLTDDGAMTFRQYYQELGCDPAVRGLQYAGAAEARLSDEVLDALHAEDLEAVVIGPANPYHGIRPILELAGMRELVRGRGAPVIPVPPVVGALALADESTERAVQRALIERDQHWAEFAARLHARSLDALHARQLLEPASQFPDYDRSRMAQEREAVLQLPAPAATQTAPRKPPA